jgi:uncharacterized protein YceH (UPF0502 family)
MKIQLSAVEARIIGSLIEKQVTTPDQYPLSLNALTNACNQKSNREPFMQLEESAVKAAVDGLARRHLIVEKSGFGSRVPKYQQIFCNTEFGSLKFTPQETAIVCELLLRGPQTPGELRARVPRMAELPDPGIIETLLQGLAQRADGAIVTQLAREPGRRDSRWAQLFEERPAGTMPDDGASGPPAVQAPRAPAAVIPHAPAASPAALEARVAALESEVAALRSAIATLQSEQGS